MTFRARARAFQTSSAGRFPLSFGSNNRFLRSADGAPFLIMGDTPWSIVVQLTQPAQVDSYLDQRQSQGFNTIMFNMIEHYFSSQTPFYRDVAGNDPFSGMTQASVDWEAEVEAYWTRVDYIVNAAKQRNMLCILFPAYLGFGGGAGVAGDQGWDFAVDNSTDAKLQAYGTWLAQRYTQGNVIWAMGGDYDAPNPEKGWNIATGIRSVTSNAIITYHGGRGSSAYVNVNGLAGFNFNNIYCGADGVSYDDAAVEFARSGPLPFFLIEGGYGNAETDAAIRRQTYQALCAGACGALYGTYNIWGFGEPNANGAGGAAAALASDMSNTSTTEFLYAKALFDAYQWHLLAPSTGTGLVTSSLSTGTTRVCPALASDGSFAMIYVPSSQTVTVNMAALSPGSVRVRLYNPTSGAYSTAGGSPFANSGTQGIATGGERVIVLDAA